LDNEGLGQRIEVVFSKQGMRLIKELVARRGHAAPEVASGETQTQERD
jgi:hypothetical protein